MKTTVVAIIALGLAYGLWIAIAQLVGWVQL